MNEKDVELKAALERILARAKAQVAYLDSYMERDEYPKNTFPAGHVLKLVNSIAALQSALAKLEEKKK